MSALPEALFGDVPMLPIYLALNRAMRRVGSLASSDPERVRLLAGWGPLVRRLISGMERCPRAIDSPCGDSSSGGMDLWRGMVGNFEEVAGRFVGGGYVVFTAFTSATPSLLKAYLIARAGCDEEEPVVWLMKMTGFHGRRISMCSLFPMEDEYVFVPHTKFMCCACYLQLVDAAGEMVNVVHLVEERTSAAVVS